MDAQKASVYAEGLLTKLNAKVSTAATTGSYADYLKAFDFIFKDLCTELFGIEQHTTSIHVLDLSTIQDLFRDSILTPLAKDLYSKMKAANKAAAAAADLQNLFSSIIEQRDIYGGMVTINAIAYIYVNAGIPTPPEIKINK